MTLRHAALAALAALAATPQLALAQTKFTFATTNGPKDLSSLAAVRWQAALKERSKGALDMNFVPGGALGGDKQLLQQLVNNEIQLHVAGPVVVHHLLRQYQCMEAEYVFKDEAHGLRAWTGTLGREVNALLEKEHGVTMVAIASRGARHLTANVPVRKPEDLKGVKVRVTNPLRADVFKAYGALPGNLSIAELYGALRAGVFDAQENPIPTIWGNKFFEVQKFINLTGHVWSYNVFSANKRFVDSLPGAQREAFFATLRESIDWLNKAVAEDTRKLLAAMEATGKTKVIRSDVAAFKKIAEPIVEKFAAEKCRPGLLADIAKLAN